MISKIKQVTTVATDILVCLMEDGSIYQTTLKGRNKGKWIAINLPKYIVDKNAK